MMDIQIIFKPVGSAPILRQTRYTYHLNPEHNQPFVEIVDFLDGLLWPDPHPKCPLYLYIQSIFTPAMDEQLINLFKVRS
jgi:hypothetical protein